MVAHATNDELVICGLIVDIKAWTSWQPAKQSRFHQPGDLNRRWDRDHPNERRDRDCPQTEKSETIYILQACMWWVKMQWTRQLFERSAPVLVIVTLGVVCYTVPITIFFHWRQFPSGYYISAGTFRSMQVFFLFILYVSFLHMRNPCACRRYFC